MRFSCARFLPQYCSSRKKVEEAKLLSLEPEDKPKGVELRLEPLHWTAAWDCYSLAAAVLSQVRCPASSRLS